MAQRRRSRGRRIARRARTTYRSARRRATQTRRRVTSYVQQRRRRAPRAKSKGMKLGGIGSNDLLFFAGGVVVGAAAVRPVKMRLLTMLAGQEGQPIPEEPEGLAGLVKNWGDVILAALTLWVATRLKGRAQLAVGGAAAGMLVPRGVSYVSKGIDSLMSPEGSSENKLMSRQTGALPRPVPRAQYDRIRAMAQSGRPSGLRSLVAAASDVPA